MEKFPPNVLEAHKYAEDVLSGKILTGRLLKLACERWFNDLRSAPDRGFKFEPLAADRIISFFSFLKHSKGEWGNKEFKLEPWQKFLLAYNFGWLKAATNTRRFRESYNELPRKNGKSTLAGGVGLYLFFADGEPGAEVYSAATKRDQARIVHSEAIRMVKASNFLSERIGIFKDNLHVVSTNSKFEPLGADMDTLDGLNIHGAVIDELHAHKRRAMYDVLNTATDARREPLIFSITTAGFDRTSLCWELHQHAAQVLEGIIEDDSFCCFIAAADDDDDFSSETSWIKANPNYNISVKPDGLRAKAQKAKSSPGDQNAFRRLHLNQWTEQSVRWLNMAKWDENKETFSEDSLKGLRCYAGLDLSSTQDLTAFALIFQIGEKIKVIPRFWIPADNINTRPRRNQEQFLNWIRSGVIQTTPGNVVDQDFIRKEINTLGEKFKIEEIAIDRWNAMQISIQLGSDGFTIAPFGQGFKDMSGPSKKFEELVLSGRLDHNKNPVLRWNAANCTVETDAAENVKPVKESKTERIDGVISIIMALGRLMVHDGYQKSVYDKRGILSLG